MVDKYSKKVDFLLAVFICTLLHHGILHAQTANEDFMVINTLQREDGLPDLDINGMYFDSMGYAWISTFGGGLVRYDGDSFLEFSTKNDPEFLGDIVSQCREDRYGRLWIPTSGMDIIDMKTFTHLGDMKGMSKAWRRSHFPSSLRSDSNGCLWFTSGEMLFRVAFANNGNTFIVDSLQCSVTNANLMPKPEDVEGDGSAWITLGGHFYKVRYIDGKGLQLSAILPEVNIGEDNRATAYLRSGKDIWVGTMNGLYQINSVTGTHTCYKHSESDRYSLPNNEITGLCMTPDGEIVVGTLGGVCILDQDTRTFDIYGSRTNAYGERILPGEIVRSIVTRDGQIWVGLEAEGLVILQKKNLHITNLSRIETTGSPIPSAPARAVFIDSKGDIWLAATGFGLCRQVGDMVFRNYNVDNSLLSGNSITSFCEDGNGRIWTGTVDGHLNYINMSGPDTVHVPAGNDSELAKNIDVILGLAYDRVNDYIWIAARNGLYVYDVGNSCFIDPPIRRSACLGVSARQDLLWISSMEGVSVVDLNALESRTIAGLPACMTIVTDGDTAWCGTFGNGLYKLDGWESDNPDITVYSVNDGLADNQIHGLLMDGIYLWVTTENGLSRLDTQTGEIRSFGINDGLRSMAFCENSIAKGSDGKIYLGLKGGGLSILQSSYVSNDSGSHPDVRISGYYSKGEFHNLSFSDTISKEEKDMDMTLKFSDVSYRAWEDIVYESRVYPMQKEWSPAFGNDKHIKPGHIPGGKYLIQVRAVDHEGKVLSTDEKTLDVKPVLYKQWWFRLLVLLSLALLARTLWSLYTRSANRSKELLQQEVARQTKILNDQKKELERKAEKLSEQNALLQKQNEMIASHNTLFANVMSSKESDFNSELLNAIQKMYKDPGLDVYGLAEAMGMSRSALNEKIQRALGQSIAQFIRTYRLNVAKEMIVNGTNRDMNVSEIAYEVGFNDPKYFTRCFTKEFGSTPSDLQKQNKDTLDG